MELTLEDKVAHAANKLVNSINPTITDATKKLNESKITALIMQYVNMTDEEYRNAAIAKLTPAELKVLK